MCYSIYLIHYEVISAVGRSSKAIGASLPSPAYLVGQFARVGAAMVVICGCSLMLLEKPCMRRDWPQRLQQGFRKALAAVQSPPKESFAD
jgi:peptidoglycan/LPS O-acetylase OafA/YrhL